MLPTVWILGDQLSPHNSALLPPHECRVLIIESVQRSAQLPYHTHKLALIWSAMRHFRDELRAQGYEVDYREEAPDFAEAFRQHAAQFKPEVVRLMQPSEHGVRERLTALIEPHATVEITPESLFVCTTDEFREFLGKRKSVVFEEFYRWMRRKTGLLMDGDEPAGGAWNFDVKNRQTPPPGHVFPQVPDFPRDSVTLGAIDAVRRHFPDNFGDLDSFWWPTSRAQAEDARHAFLTQRLDLFGPYEDALVSGERALYHSALSALMNVGLLNPLESARMAEREYREGRARIESVEGYIRQVVGWREFVRQHYWLRMPELKDVNVLNANEPLPGFYTSAETKMNCLHETVETLRRYGTTHHIQRLMVLGNFALIAGISPQEMKTWFWASYADAYDWVVTPNVLSISLYADGGLKRGGIATKPYGSTARYINEMSDYCERCAYNQKKTVGDDACPFNALYWDFLERNSEAFAGNLRMKNILGATFKRKPEAREEIRERAEQVRQALREGREPLGGEPRLFEV